MSTKKKQKTKLTKRVVDRLTTSAQYGERHYDSEIRGFGVKVFRSGRKSFFLDYGPKGRRRRITLGEFGVLTVEKARTAAIRTAGEVAAGSDPLAEREKLRSASTFGEWVGVYMESLVGRKKPSSIKMDKLYLGRASKRWKNRPLTEITVSDVERFFESQKERGTCTANRSLASLRTCLSSAWRRDLIPENPGLKVKPLPEPSPRTRVLNDEELKRLVDAVAAVSDEFVRTAFLLLIETGARRSEVLSMRWEHLDLSNIDRATWYLPLPKRQKPETKPLTRSLAVMLSGLPRKSEYVIAGRFPDKPRRDLKRWWARLCEDAKIFDVRTHDIRRTFGLEVARSAGLHVASKLLGHSSVRVTERVYAPLGIDELREASEEVHRSRGAQILPFPGKAQGKKSD